jgi:hypothetical protein
MKKRRNTGGKRPQFYKKRKYQLGRPSAMTKLGEKSVREVRTMGGNKKFRALRVEVGNFSWGSEGAFYCSGHDAQPIRLIHLRVPFFTFNSLHPQDPYLGCCLQRHQ